VLDSGFPSLLLLFDRVWIVIRSDAFKDCENSVIPALFELSVLDFMSATMLR
tara:strand:+ start:62 stop:217 length:156 start_codon:yes stop_codon:yes gene_type:complete